MPSFMMIMIPNTVTVKLSKGMPTSMPNIVALTMVVTGDDDCTVCIQYMVKVECAHNPW